MGSDCAPFGSIQWVQRARYYLVERFSTTSVVNLSRWPHLFPDGSRLTSAPPPTFPRGRRPFIVPDALRPCCKERPETEPAPDLRTLGDRTNSCRMGVGKHHPEAHGAREVHCAARVLPCWRRPPSMRCRCPLVMG